MCHSRYWCGILKMQILSKFIFYIQFSTRLKQLYCCNFAKLCLLTNVDLIYRNWTRHSNMNAILKFNNRKKSKFWRQFGDNRVGQNKRRKIIFVVIINTRIFSLENQFLNKSFSSCISVETRTCSFQLTIIHCILYKKNWIAPFFSDFQVLI